MNASKPVKKSLKQDRKETQRDVSLLSYCGFQILPSIRIGNWKSGQSQARQA